MSQELLYSIVFINLAFLFYTIGIWAEFFKKKLLIWHSVFFWFGVLTDTVGTGLMIQHVGHIKFTIHTTTGFAGLSLMLFHAFWATVVLIKNESNTLMYFHKFSVVVWLIWFVSYLSGLVMGVKSVSS